MCVRSPLPLPSDKVDTDTDWGAEGFLQVILCSQPLSVMAHSEGRPHPPPLPCNHRVILLPVGLLLCGPLTWPPKTLSSGDFLWTGSWVPDFVGEEGFSLAGPEGLSPSW